MKTYRTMFMPQKPAPKPKPKPKRKAFTEPMMDANYKGGSRKPRK